MRIPVQAIRPIELVVLAPDVAGAERHLRADLAVEADDELARAIVLDVGVNHRRRKGVGRVGRVVGVALAEERHRRVDFIRLHERVAVGVGPGIADEHRAGGGELTREVAGRHLAVVGGIRRRTRRSYRRP